ncbi:MAG: hypothetical protein KFF68_09270 [Desulfosarcina sp.]|nr:hypothetical protein [Desulfosarcina sp.]
MITIDLFTGHDDLACPAAFNTAPPGLAPTMAASAGKQAVVYHLPITASYREGEIHDQ